MRYLISFLVAFQTVSAVAQVNLSLSAGYGGYAMGDMKDLQSSIAKEIPVPLQPVSSFPSYYNFEASCIYALRSNFYGGLILGYGSTGGRLDYNDYSGTFRVDQLLKYYSLNSSVGFVKSLPGKNNLQLYFDLRPGVIWTHFDLKIFEQIGNSATTSIAGFKSFNINVQPTITLTKQIDSFGLFFQAGYNVNVLKGRLNSNQVSGAYLTDNDHEVKADWSGFRCGIGISYSIQKKLKTE